MNNSKKPRTRIIASLLVALVAVGGVGFWSHLHDAHGRGHSHDHEHAASDEAALTLDNGKRWQSDAALRAGMQRIRDAAAVVLGAGAQGVPSSAATKQFAATVQESVGYLVQNCKLEPKADAALHVIINDLMTGAGTLAGNPSSPEGAQLVTRALQRYPQYFEHPGWEPLPTAEPRG